MDITGWESNETTRGLQILVASLTTGKYKRFSQLCNYFATTNHAMKTNPNAWERTNAMAAMRKCLLENKMGHK